jgi:hypothetical protein
VKFNSICALIVSPTISHTVQAGLPFPMEWDKLKDKGKELKNKLKVKGKNIFRPHGPVPPIIHRTEHEADIPLLAPVPTIRKREDKAEDFLDRFLAPNFHASTNDDSQDADQLIPTNTTKESPKSSERFSSPPKRTFVRTADPQHDIAVLHVAFVLKNSPDLQDLILAVEKLNKKPSVR